MARTSTTFAFLAGAAGAAAIAFAIGAGPHDDAHKSDHKADHATQEMSAPEGMEGMTPDMIAEMAAWMEAGTPGEHHKMLARSNGEWNADCWFKMDPDAPAIETTGTLSSKPMLGGRYFQGNMHIDDMMGMPFDGFALMGYDNIGKKYFSVWIDTMSTSLYMAEGQMKDGKLVLTGTMTEPSGKKTKTKMVTEWVDDNHMTDTMYDMVDGEWNLHGKIEYTRKGH